MTWQTARWDHLIPDQPPVIPAWAASKAGYIQAVHVGEFMNEIQTGSAGRETPQINLTHMCSCRMVNNRTPKEKYSPPFWSSSSSLSCSVRYSSSPSKISRRLRMESLSPLTMFSPTKRGRNWNCGDDNKQTKKNTHIATNRGLARQTKPAGSETGSVQKRQCSLKNKRLYWVRTQQNTLRPPANTATVSPDYPSKSWAATGGLHEMC